MQYFYVTGASSGIGKSIVERLLREDDIFVIGISRRCAFEHERYRHIPMDLSDTDAVKSFDFDKFEDAESYTLINNAGVLGKLGHVGSLDADKIIHEYNVNIVAPAILTNAFINQYSDFSGNKVILNTSSGAARHTIPSWSTYCSTKAALDMYSEVINDEQKEQGSDYPFYVFSIAPGIIDTPMQEELRSTSKEKFENVDQFIDLWKNNQLVSPEQVAKEFLNIAQNPQNYNEVRMDIR